MGRWGLKDNWMEIFLPGKMGRRLRHAGSTPAFLSLRVISALEMQKVPGEEEG